MSGKKNINSGLNNSLKISQRKKTNSFNEKIKEVNNNNNKTEFEIENNLNKPQEKIQDVRKHLNNYYQQKQVENKNNYFKKYMTTHEDNNEINEITEDDNNNNNKEINNQPNEYYDSFDNNKNNNITNENLNSIYKLLKKVSAVEVKTIDLIQGNKISEKDWRTTNIFSLKTEKISRVIVNHIQEPEKSFTLITASMILLNNLGNAYRELGQLNDALK